MATTLFLINNLMTLGSLLPPQRVAAAKLTGVTRFTAGAVTIARQGIYTGTIDRLYLIEILSTGDGNFGPSTTFRWSDDGGLTWQPEQAITASGQLFTLSFGVEIIFTAGPGAPQFVVDDQWQFQARIPYGTANLIDDSRDTEFRSNTLNPGDFVDIPLDFGSAVTPTAAILYDHNILATSPVTLQASNAANFSPLLLNLTITWRSQIMAAVLPAYAPLANARYWRWLIQAGSGQNDVRVSLAYLGETITMNIPARLGFTETRNDLNPWPRDVLTRGSAAATLEPKVFEVEFGQLRDGTGQDREKLERVRSYANNQVTRTRRPFWFVLSDLQLLASQDGSRIQFVHWEGDFTLENRSDAIYAGGGALYTSRLVLSEVVRAA